MTQEAKKEAMSWTPSGKRMSVTVRWNPPVVADALRVPRAWASENLLHCGGMKVFSNY